MWEGWSLPSTDSVLATCMHWVVTALLCHLYLPCILKIFLSEAGLLLGCPRARKAQAGTAGLNNGCGFPPLKPGLWPGSVL